MAKLKLDKETLQAFFFNHTEKLVLGVVLLLLALFIWSGSSLEGIGAQNPAELAANVEAVSKKIEVPTWDNIKEEYTPSLDHVIRQQAGDAVTPENYYRLEVPLIGSTPNSATPRQDPELFAVTDVEATIVTGAIAVKASPKLVDPFADLANMEQKKIEAPKKKKKKKKSTGAMPGEAMDSMYMDEMGADEESDESMYGSMSGMDMYGGGGMMGGGATGPSVRADGDKFHGYRPNATVTATGSSVVGLPAHIVSVRGIVPYQQQWDEFERVFADAAGYMPSRDIPRYLSFRAQRAEVPSDPSEALKWGYISWTERVLDTMPKMGWAGYPGEIADAKYLLPGVLTMPVPPVMMRDLRPLALHAKVPLQEETKAKTVETTAPERIGLDEVGGVADIDELPTAPGARRPAAGGGGMYGGDESMYGGGGDMYGGGSMYGGGGDEMGGGYGMGGGSLQLTRGPEAEFLMVRFFDYIQPGKKYVYRIQVVIEDPNHPQMPASQPLDRILADTVRTRLTTLAEEEAKQTAAKKTPVRLYSLTSEWSEATAPVFVKMSSDAYAGGVTLPRMMDIMRSSEPNLGQKTGFSLPADGEPTAKVMNLTWNPKYAVDLPGIVAASRGTVLAKPIQADVIDPVTLVYKTIPEYPLSSGELVVDVRGGEVLELPAKDAVNAKPLLTPGEVAIIDGSGNFIVRNELDDWQMFDKYAPPPPVVVEAAPSASEGYGAEMDYGIYGGSGDE